MQWPGRSLYWVFWSMGFNAEQCKHLVRTLNRLRLCNMGEEEWNHKLRMWVEEEVLRSTSTVRKVLHKCLGIPIDEHSVSEDRMLFDRDFQTGIEPRPPGRPRG